MKTVENIIQYIERVLLFIAGLSLIFMMLIVVAEIILRTFFNMSIPGNFSISEKYLMPLSIFPVLSVAYYAGILPKVDMLVDKIRSLSFKRYLNAFILAIELIGLLLVTYYSYLYFVKGVNDNLSFTAGGSMIPMYPVLIIVPIGFAMLSIRTILVIYQSLVSKDFYSQQ